jgi:hypothetical protein
VQKCDGGWALATLGNWQRSDGKQQDRESSDGYGTGFVVYILRRAGAATDEPARLEIEGTLASPISGGENQQCSSCSVSSGV